MIRVNMNDQLFGYYQDVPAAMLGMKAALQHFKNKESEAVFQGMLNENYIAMYKVTSADPLEYWGVDNEVLRCMFDEIPKMNKDTHCTTCNRVGTHPHWCERKQELDQASHETGMGM